MGSQNLVWTAPEIINGSDPTLASDVYALAMTMFEVSVTYDTGVPMCLNMSPDIVWLGSLLRIS